MTTLDTRPGTTAELLSGCRARVGPALRDAAASTSGTDAGRELQTVHHHDTALTEEEVARAADLVEAAGRAGLERATRRGPARRRRQAVQGGGDAAATAGLRALAGLVVRRDR